MPRFTLGLFLLLTLCLVPAWALDDAHWDSAQASINRGVEYLRSQQNQDGSWSPKPGPAITALAMSALLDRPDISSNDPAVQKALTYILSKQKPDGGIHDGFLENYNTAICLSALARVNDRPEAAAAIARAQNYLRRLQWSDQVGPNDKPVNAEHPFYGGAGYGDHGRPDLSNTQVMLEGLYDSGLDCNDPAFQRALVFISRCQGTASNKDMGRLIKPDGGFIYATSLDKDHIGQPESKAGSETIDLPGAGSVSVLRTYGSMTYAGFKSYIYANLDRKDPRVVDAMKWIRNNYALDRNAGMPEPQHLQGHYYYLLTFSRAFDAWGADRITLADGSERDWANDLIDQLTSMQRDDGSWLNESDRWMEGDPVLVTSYALHALQHAVK